MSEKMRMPRATKTPSPPGKPIQKPHGALIIHKFLFFPPKLPPMRFPPAPRKFHWMLHMQHLVIHHISHHKFRHHFAVQLPVNHNLLQRRIKTTEHAPPDSAAPTQPRFNQSAVKISRIQPFKKLIKIVMCPSRPVLRPPRPPLPQSQQSPPRRACIRKLPLSLQQFLRRLSPDQSPEQNRSRSVHHRGGRVVH